MFWLYSGLLAYSRSVDLLALLFLLVAELVNHRQGEIAPFLISMPREVLPFPCVGQFVALVGEVVGCQRHSEPVVLARPSQCGVELEEGSYVSHTLNYSQL